MYRLTHVNIASPLQAVQSVVHSKDNLELSLDLVNLMPGINYAVYVTAVYSGNETSTAAPLHFSTSVYGMIFQPYMLSYKNCVILQVFPI